MTKDEVYKYSKRVVRKTKAIGDRYRYDNYAHELLFEDNESPDEIYDYMHRLENSAVEAKRVAKLTNIELQEMCQKYRRKIAKLKLISVGKTDDYKADIRNIEEALDELEDIAYYRVPAIKVWYILKNLDRVIHNYE